MNKQELIGQVATCACCGKPLGIAHGKQLWEYSGLESSPQQVRDAIARVVDGFEAQTLCWPCIVESLDLHATFMAAKGDLKLVAKKLSDAE